MEPPKLKLHLVELPDHEATGADCRVWRQHLKCSVPKVAKAMGISTTLLSYLERGLKSWTANRVTEFVYAVKKVKEKKRR